MTYNVYTDASVMVNDDFRAGVGVAIYCNETKSIEMSVGFNIGDAPNSTIAELTAIIYGLIHMGRYLKDSNKTATLVRVCSDCTAAIDLASGQGQSDDKSTLEILSILDNLLAKVDYDIQFQWVKGHSGHKMNEITDQLAYWHAQ